MKPLSLFIFNFFNWVGTEPCLDKEFGVPSLHCPQWSCEVLIGVKHSISECFFPHSMVIHEGAVMEGWGPHWNQLHFYCQLVWDRGISRQRILSAFVPLSTVIQGGAVGGWGPVAEAKTAESLGTTFNLCELYTQYIQTDFQLILYVSYLDLRFRQVFWFLVTWATGPTGTSTPCIVDIVDNICIF